MTVRTGVSSPWAEWDGDPDDWPEAWAWTESGDRYLYYRANGWELTEEDQGLLAEALRADGFALSLGDAYRRAERAILLTAFYGYVDDERVPARCDEHGATQSGDVVNEARRCVLAIV